MQDGRLTPRCDERHTVRSDTGSLHSQGTTTPTRTAVDEQPVMSHVEPHVATPEPYDPLLACESSLVASNEAAAARKKQEAVAKAAANKLARVAEAATAKAVLDKAVEKRLAATKPSATLMKRPAAACGIDGTAEPLWTDLMTREKASTRSRHTFCSLIYKQTAAKAKKLGLSADDANTSRQGSLVAAGEAYDSYFP